jgi:hypothetical protein
MVIFLGLLILLLVVTGLVFALGAGLVAIVPLALALAIGGWMIWAFLGARSPGEVGRRTQPAELLGPGGPDDPANTANHGGEAQAFTGSSGKSTA